RNFFSVKCTQIFELVAIFLQRMAGDKEAKDFFLSSQALVLVPVWRFGEPIVILNLFLLKDAKQSMLAGFCIALGLLRALDGFVKHGHKLGTAAERVHSAAFDQRFEHTLVEQAQVHLLAKRENRLEFS